MKPSIISITLLVGFAFSMPGHADHGCNGIIMQVDVGGQTFYLDDRSTKAGEINHWFYLESNGIDDLQTGGDNDPFDDTWLPGFPVDGCNHANPDQLII